MAQNEKFTADEMAKALTENKGFISVTARRLGCTAQTVRNYVKRYASCQSAAHEAREEMKDYTENQLMQQIKDGNITAIIFYLKTQAKDRGYTERTEITGAEGGAVTLRVVYEDKHNA